MDCISCDRPGANILYNEMFYCKTCYNTMLKRFKQYAKAAEEKRVKSYEPPVKITDNIFIGSIDSVDVSKLMELHINNIVISGKELKKEEHSSFNILELPLDDSFEQEIISYVKIAYKFIKDAIDISGNVLIHCYSGISRSGSILVGYIMIDKHMTYDEAFSFVKAKYPKLFPNKNFEKQLRMFESEILKKGGRKNKNKRGTRKYKKKH